MHKKQKWKTNMKEISSRLGILSPQMIPALSSFPIQESLLYTRKYTWQYGQVQCRQATYQRGF